MCHQNYIEILSKIAILEDLIFLGAMTPPDGTHIDACAGVLTHATTTLHITSSPPAKNPV